MTEQREDNVQFKMRTDTDDAIEDRVIPTEINELKLEKISHRVTLISIIIPVLIVIVLGITYLDIKKRVVQTEDTGNFEVNKLSSDLESRFSSLSLRQARLEDSVEKLVEQINHSIANIQVRIEKLNDSIKATAKTSVGQNEHNATKEELVKQINSVVDATNQTGVQIAAITKELKKQMDQLSAGLKSTKEKMDEANNKLIDLEDTKIDRPAMDLAIRIETMRAGSELKVRVETLQNKMNEIEKAMTALSQKVDSPSKPAPTPNSPQSIQLKDETQKIEEQTISK